MIPLRCPNCGLQWNVREDSPPSVTCPICLAAVPKPPPVIAYAPPPLPIRPLEYDVRLDTRASGIGVWILMGIIVLGFGGALMSGAPWTSVTAVFVTGGLALVAAIALIIAAAGGFQGRSGRRSNAAQLALSICLAIFLIMGGCVALLFGACAVMFNGI
jgi:hypothetical protein